MKRTIVLVAMIALGLVLPQVAYGQLQPTELDKVYRDETHCLVAPEILSDENESISCYCRDAVVDARYIYFTYMRTGKDPNLNGPLLSIQSHAQRMCGEDYDIWEATTSEDWKWDGPEVVRVYPPDGEIEQITPDSRGFRLVRYEVQLVYHDQQGRVTKVENFQAHERLPVP